MYLIFPIMFRKKDRRYFRTTCARKIKCKILHGGVICAVLDRQWEFRCLTEGSEVSEGDSGVTQRVTELPVHESLLALILRSCFTHSSSATGHLRSLCISSLIALQAQRDTDLRDTCTVTLACYPLKIFIFHMASAWVCLVHFTAFKWPHQLHSNVFSWQQTAYTNLSCDAWCHSLQPFVFY